LEDVVVIGGLDDVYDLYDVGMLEGVMNGYL
jgi:hypothetical protein